MARVSILCDVVYEKSPGRWSDYFRTKVEFIKGSDLEMFSQDANTIFAVIWFSQTECAVIKTSQTSVFDFDFSSAYYLIKINDMLNEGILGTQVNGNRNVLWRIYGKEEDGTLIDSRFGVYPYERKSNGERRSRPMEERKYPRVVVVNTDIPNFYIVKSENNTYQILSRNTLISFYGTVKAGDVLFLNHNGSEISIENYTQKYTGLYAKLAYSGNSMVDCIKWINDNGVGNIEKSDSWFTSEFAHNDESTATISYSSSSTGNRSISSNYTLDKSLSGRSSMSISKSSLSLNVGQTAKLYANNYGSSLTWESDNSKVASVTSNGVVKGVSAGATNIWAKGYELKRCYVTVSESSSSSFSSNSNSSNSRIIYSKEATVKVGQRIKAQLSEGNITRWEVLDYHKNNIKEAGDELIILGAGEIQVWGYIEDSPKFFSLTIIE